MLPQSPVSLHTAASTLLKWLDEHQKQSSTRKAVRARVPVNPGHNAPLSWLRANYSSQRLFFRSREQSFEVAALGFAYIASGPTFTQQVQSSLVAILNPKYPDMRFYGASRFDPSDRSRRDPEWRLYKGFTFVLPAVELFRDHDGQFFLAANYYPSSEPSLLRNLLHRIVATPLSLQTLDASFMIPRAKSVVDLTMFSTWDAAMSNILRQLSSSQYDKIVLARRKRLSFPSACAPDPIHVIAALDEQNREDSSFYSHPTSSHGKSANQNAKGGETRNSYLFCLQLDRDNAFVGCTPECLFYLKDKDIWTEALAGTVRRSADGSEGEVLSELLSQKNLEEHRFVVDYIRQSLTDLGAHVKTDGPHIRRLPRLMHLLTHIRSEIPRDQATTDGNPRSGLADRTENVFKALEIMHPTPAVCGMPRERTMTELQKLEDFDRGFFAGPLGWFSYDSGEFCVAIRSALIHGSNVTAFAGSGIVQASESKSEWEETELKMSAFIDLFVRPGRKNRRKRSSQVFKEFGMSPSLSSRSYVRGHVDDGMQQDPLLANGECYGKDFSGVTTPATLVEGASRQESSHVVSRSTSTSSISSMRTFATSAFSSQLVNEDKYFDPLQIEKLPNINTLWGCCCVEELCRNGVRTFFVAPGSRSAPLAVGVVRSRHAHLYVSHDERGAGFLAVGYARASRRAAAVITTSGTAVANLLPAVVEASMDSLPVILLTADRPPELRDVGANQAIFQPGIFGEYTRWSKDFPCPSSEIPLRNLLSDVDYAVHMSGSSSTFDGNAHAFRGPVQLNMMFREKIAPDHQQWDRSCTSSIPSKWKVSSSPMTTYVQRMYESGPTCSRIGEEFWSNDFELSNNSIIAALKGKQAGLVVVGGGSGAAQTENDGLAIYEVARLLGWPVVSDICGGLRFDNSSHEMIHYADQIYSSELACQMLGPDAVLQFGERITSKRIARLIQYASSTCEDFVHVMVSDSAKRIDPMFTVSHRVVSDIPSILRDVSGMMKDQSCHNDRDDAVTSCKESDEFRTGSGASKLMKLAQISQRVDQVLGNMLTGDESDRLTEPWCARVVSESLETPCGLFIGNSMPIRDLDAFAGCKTNGLCIKVAGNRGASGIDGIISSGIGFGIGLNMDVTIMLGDMSMIHDMNALHLLRSEDDSIRMRVTIVVVNNGGGGIFSMLPIAKHRDVFSPVFDSPHGIEFSKVCEMFGIEYRSATTPAELRAAIRKPHERHRVIEAVIVDDHASNAALHHRLSANVAQQVSAALTDNRN